MWASLSGEEEDEAGRGNPATLGSITAVFWLAPEGVMTKGAPIRGIRIDVWARRKTRGSLSI